MIWVKVKYFSYFKLNKKKNFNLIYLLKEFKKIKFFSLKKKKKLFSLVKSPKCYKYGKLLLNYEFFKFFIIFFFKFINIKKNNIILYFYLLKNKYLRYQSLFLNNSKIEIKFKLTFKLNFFMLTVFLLYYLFFYIFEISFINGWGGVFISFIFMFLQVLFFTTCERKILALTQRRIGPQIVGDMGRLQYIADALKLIFKTYSSPRKINLTFFYCSALVAFWSSWYGYCNLSFNYGEDVIEIEYNIFFFISCSLAFSLAWLVSGWSSTSKYALLGCIRAGLQIISYEIIMSGIFLILFSITGTVNFEMIINQQINLSIFFFIPLITIICFIATLMETNRPPFDLSEAESDVVAGYTIEYTGILFGLFYLGEYVNLFVNSFIIVILFSGGYWNIFNQLLILVETVKYFLLNNFYTFYTFYTNMPIWFFLKKKFFYIEYNLIFFFRKDFYEIDYKNIFIFLPLY